MKNSFYIKTFNNIQYSVSLRIQSECSKIRTRITPNTGTFYAVITLRIPYPLLKSKTGNNDFYPNAMIQTKYTPYPFDGHGSWCSANTSGQLILSIT